jgi:hypothetical protein
MFPLTHFQNICMLSLCPDFDLHSDDKQQTPWSLVRERTIPTERRPLVDLPTLVDRGVSRGQRGGSPTVVNLSFLDRRTVA